MECSKKYYLLASSAIAMLTLSAGQVFAQNAGGGLPLAKASKDDTTEVIVTAQKRSEVASKTPLAITAYTGDTLKSVGVVSVADIQNIAPSVNIGKDGFGVNINIRGVTTTDTTSKGEQGIAFNVDGIPLGRPREQGLAFFDVQRVEVLRGPQGTLYGKSSTGGAINVITNKPGKFFAASADAELGSYNTRRLNLMLNTPVNDNLAFRFALNSNKRDGWLSLTGGYPARNDENNVSWRMSMLANLTPNSTLLLTYTGGQVRGIGGGTVPLVTVTSNSGKSQRQAFGNPFGGKQNEDFGNFTAQYDGEFGPVKTTFVGAHMKFNANDLTSSTNDPNGNTGGPFSGFYNWINYRGDVKTDYAELRFSNADSGPLDWVVGLNYSKEDIHESDHNWSAPIATPTVAASTNGIDPLNQTVHTSSAIFAQATWHATDQLNLTLGARRSTDEVNRHGTFAAGPGPWLDPSGKPCVAPNDCVGGANNGFESATKPTYRLAVDYKMSTNDMVYGSMATGYKAGGFNDFDASTGGVGTYEPEELTAYEVGYKGRPINGLQFNSNVFYYDYAKDQISSLVMISGNVVIYTKSVPAKISGWENEVHYRPTSDDTIDASLVVMGSKYVNFKTGFFGNVDWSGRRLDKTPGTSGNFAYSHVWTLVNDNTLVARISTKYSSGYTVSDFQNAMQYKQQSFTRSDLTLTYNLKGGTMYVQGFVKNLEDKLQMIGAPGGYNASVPLALNIAASEPRMVGVRFGAKY